MVKHGAKVQITYSNGKHRDGIVLEHRADGLLIIGQGVHHEALNSVAVDGEKSWVDGGFGKLRSSGDRDGDFHLKPQLGNANLIWQPQFTWSLSAIVFVLPGLIMIGGWLNFPYLQSLLVIVIAMIAAIPNKK